MEERDIPCMEDEREQGSTAVNDASDSEKLDIPHQGPRLVAPRMFLVYSHFIL